MIRQIALALLALFLTLPAVAAPLCHAPVTQSASADHGTMDHSAMGRAMPAPADDDRQSPPASTSLHGCLGCAAPVAPAPEPAFATLPPQAAPALPVRKLTGIAAVPALRPPQS